MRRYVIENFLTEEQECKLQKLTVDPNFPWFFTPGTIVEIEAGITSKSVYDKGINPCQMVHSLNLNECNFLEIVAPVLNQLSVEFQSNIRILRCKFNFLPKGTDSTHHYPHIDDSENGAMSALYYVNDSDGDTYFFNKELDVTYRISPKKGSMVVFESNEFHSSSSPINSEYRIVMNIVFKLLSEEL